MARVEEVKQIIQTNQEDIAFIIGNGIHRYENDEALAWDKLLIELWNVTQTNKITQIHPGTTNTEFYDILEMNCERMAKIQIKNEIEKLSKTSYPSFAESSELFEKVNKFATHKPADDMNVYVAKMAEEYKTLNTESLIKTIQLIEQQQALFGLQTYISSVMGRWEYNDYHKRIIEKLRDHNAPVLTTNFDKVLENAISLKKHKLGDKRLSDYYPWSVYYSKEELDNPLNGFGVWHINGVVDYRRSIKLGLSQYMGCVSRARQMVQRTKGGKELFHGKDQSDWVGKDSWLHIIFNKSLFVFGLSLAENEVFLRWLLIQRALYFSRFPERKHQGWYLTTKADIDKEQGKRFFLEQVGFEIIEVESYKVINEDIWE